MPLKGRAVAGFRYVNLSGKSELELVLRGTDVGEMMLFDLDSQKEIARVGVDPAIEWQSVKTAIDYEHDRIWLGFKYKGKGSIDFFEFR